MHEADLISRDLLNTLKRRAATEVRQELAGLRAENKRLRQEQASSYRLKAEVEKLRNAVNSQGIVTKKILDQYRLMQQRLNTKVSYRLRDALKMTSGFQWYTQAGRALKSLQSRRSK